MSRLRTVRVDEKGRVTIPREVREELEIQPGTTLFMQRDGQVLRFALAQDPFDGLANYAVAQRDQGQARGLRDYARERNLNVDAE